jgi:hypothetical protein
MIGPGHHSRCTVVSYDGSTLISKAFHFLPMFRMYNWPLLFCFIAALLTGLWSMTATVAQRRGECGPPPPHLPLCGDATGTNTPIMSRDEAASMETAHQEEETKELFRIGVEGRLRQKVGDESCYFCSGIVFGAHRVIL